MSYVSGFSCLLCIWHPKCYQCACIVYIPHPKYLWNVISHVGYLKAHPLSCLAWWDWLLSRWASEASSFAFLCVRTRLFPNLYLMRKYMSFLLLMSLDHNIMFVLVQVSEEHHCYICGYVHIVITIFFLCYFVICHDVWSMLLLFSSGTCLLCSPCSSTDEPVHEIRGICWYFIREWCPVIYSNSPWTAAVACWCLQFDVLLLRWLYRAHCAAGLTFCAGRNLILDRWK